MELFDVSWIGMVITALGTLFLIGEVLVNARGLFALLGLGFITVYFSAYVETSSFILMLVIYFVGLLLIVVDGKVVNDGTLATLGLAAMVLSVALAAPDFITGLYAVLGVLLGAGGSLLFLKVFKTREMWTKIALTDQLTDEAGYSSMNKQYKSLVGMTGVTLNSLRPSGTIRIENKDYSAVSNGQWIEKGVPVKVIHVDGTKIMVEMINE
ncbi:NfeD family protein [Virgibacillus xinjiangensis]|uniref:NfeD family protein n=1 Tax=Virgibacillus xinjiangensis TaxID=393090 RepID=A0ABV7CS25_9BACI